MEINSNTLWALAGIAIAFASMALVFGLLRFHRWNSARIKRKRFDALFEDWFNENGDLFNDIHDVQRAVVVLKFIQALNPNQSLEWCLESLGNSLRNGTVHNGYISAESYSIH